MESPLATAFMFTIGQETGAAGIHSKIIQTKKITIDPADKKGMLFIVHDEPPEVPKEVTFFQAHGRMEGVWSLLMSLTDDLIWNQWFKVKEHKKKSKKTAEVS